ncbi:MAG TPA: methyltransferase domain-containing protein [Thermohalobaculum sp.]|nr:methyltransferase domain-containing protein [Thermohalobaculum sp.]
MTEKRRLHDVEGLNERLQAITRRARVDPRYLHDDRTREHIVEATRDCALILDVGASMREHLGALEGRVETLDLNDFGDYPDMLGDVCSPFPDDLAGRYDAVIALALLEHVYDPPAAVANFRKVLKPGGRLFLYVPWMWRYHAPRGLEWQDYQRLSRDGMAYLLRDWEDVTLYPLRGKYSAILNMLKIWKRTVERRFGGRINRLVDARTSGWRNTCQTSGFFAEARRPEE